MASIDDTGAARLDKSARRQRKLGQKLAVAKQACFATGGTWSTFVRDAFQLSRERADELIRIGTRHTTVDDERDRKKQRMRESRQRRSQLTDDQRRDTSKAKFLRCVERAREIGDRAASHIDGKPLSAADLDEMRRATSAMIAAWNELFEPSRRLT